MHQSNTLKTITIFFAFLLFTIVGVISLDPDLGWHLRFGDLVLQQGIPKTDPFSYSMPSYHFINHEWLTDIFLFQGFRYFNTQGLAFFFAGLAIASILIQTSYQNRTTKYTLVLLLMSSAILLPLSGIRPQIISWFFFSLIVRLAWDKKLWSKWRNFIPLLFLFWANLHGAFPMGLLFLLLFLTAKFWVLKQLNWQDILVVCLAFLATLINPYGLTLWKEIWLSASDVSLRWTVAEWMPAILPNIILWIYVASHLVLVSLYRKTLSPEIAIPYLIFFVLGISSIRHLPFWVILSIPVYSIFLDSFMSEVNKEKERKKRLETILPLLKTMLFILVVIQIFFTLLLERSHRENSFFPTQAITFLQANPSPGNVFSVYEWGGYLLWKMPEKKVFIDGRMPSWKQSTNLRTESSYAYAEYRAILKGVIPFPKIAEKYQVTRVMLPVQKNKTIAEKFLAKYFPPQKQDSLYNQLEQLRWKIIYKDSVAQIYQKP